MKLKIAIWLLPILALPVLVGFGQDVVNRIPGASYFTLSLAAKDYGGSPANWSAVQGRDGRIYVGNDEGLLVYDGSVWQRVDLLDGAIIRSLALGSDGKIFIGSYNSFGFLSADEKGSLVYNSISANLESDFGNVWNTCSIGSRTIFGTSGALYVWEDNELSVIGKGKKLHKSFCLGSDFYVREVGHGLLRLSDSELVPVPGGVEFADYRIYAILDIHKSDLLLATRESGMFLLDKNGDVTRFETEVDEYFENHAIYDGIRLTPNEILFGTLGGGAVAIDNDGQLVSMFSVDDGLNGNVINSLFRDFSGGLWFTFHNNGITRIDYPLKVSHFDVSNGLYGTVVEIVENAATIVAATGSGLEYLGPADGNRLRFAHMDALPIANSLEIARGQLYAGTEGGLYTVAVPDQAIQLSDRNTQALFWDVTRNRLIIGTTEGLQYQELDASDRSPIHSLDNIHDDVRSVAVSTSGDIWLGIRLDGLRHLQSIDDTTVAKYDTTHGLPIGTPQVELVSGQPAFVFEDGFFRFDSLSTRFFIDSTAVPNRVSDSNALLDVYEDNDGNVWSVFTNDVYVAEPTGMGTYSILRHPDLSFKRENVSQIYVEDSGLVWISSGNELVRYDPSIEKSYEMKYPPIIRRVTASRKDSVIFHGATMPGTTVPVPSLQYGENDLRVEYAAPEFNAPEKTQYSFKLEGRGNEWSQWSTKSSFDFNNLREGEYRFVVKARNSMGYVSPEGSYSFVILPPWYRTWWSFLLFAMLFLGLAYFSLKYYLMTVANRRAQEQARELARERIVNEKLQEANGQLHVANARLKEVNSLKDEFLATTSHELRTPLTAILGYAAILKEEITGPQREFVDIIEQSSNRLMHTLNSVLDLAKLRSGTTDLKPVPMDLARKAEDLATTYKDIAASQGLTLECSIPDQPVPICADEYAVATVIDSLLDNAIKFTHQGSVRLTVTSNESHATLTISDDGVGMDPEFLPKIFDEFRQESDGLARTHTGNGLGLSIVAKMIELLDGSIEVTSEKGVGSKFAVILKLDAKQQSTPTPNSDRPPTAKLSNTNRHPSSWLGKEGSQET